jgi:hypothetical protein
LSQYDDRLQTVDAELATAAEHCNRTSHALEEGQKEKEQMEDNLKKVSADSREALVCKRDFNSICDLITLLIHHSPINEPSKTTSTRRTLELKQRKRRSRPKKTVSSR